MNVYAIALHVEKSGGTTIALYTKPAMNKEDAEAAAQADLKRRGYLVLDTITVEVVTNANPNCFKEIKNEM